MMRAVFAAACRAAAGHADTEIMARALPELLRESDGVAAVALARAAQFNDAALPEALTLFAIPKLTPRQQYRLAAAILPASAAWLDAEVARLAECHGRLGRLGFSFPLWRYLAQDNQGGGALLEAFGMRRLRRDSDRYGNGKMRHMGAGYAHDDGATYVEYRQAYLIAASRAPGEEATLLIRNNSYFFGRDRLPEPVYAGWTPLPDAALQAIDEAHVAGLSPWRTAVTAADLPAAEKLRRAARLLDQIDAFDARLHDWLWDAGRPATIARLRNLAAANEAPILATLDARLPPWFPTRALPAITPVLDRLEKGGPARLFGQGYAEPHGKLAILSGTNGDLPFSFF